MGFLRRRVGLALAFVLAAGVSCAKPPSKILDARKIEFPDYERKSDGKKDPPPPHWSPRHISPRAALDKPMRPTVVASFGFDWEKLPLYRAVKGSELHVSFGHLRDGPGATADTELLAEIIVGPRRIFTRPESSSPLSLAVAPVLQGRLYRDHDVVVCGFEQGTQPVSLQGIHVRGLRADAAEYVAYEGRLVGKECQVTLTQSAEAAAIALVPGLVYAFKKADSLVVLAPGSTWATATVAPNERPRLGGPLSIQSVPVRKGSSASIDLQIDWRAIAYFAGLRGPAPTWATRSDELATDQTIGITIEVLWPEERESPEGQGFVSAVTADGARLLDLRSSMRPPPMPPRPR